MVFSLLQKFFGTANDRQLKKFQKEIHKINALEPKIQALSDEELRAQTQLFKKRLADGQLLDDIMVEAFATVREAGRRVLGLRLFDVQLIGGMVLHNGMLSEMKTGEGKTLVATLPAYLNALNGRGVHVVTVNDYLAKRDAEEMGRIYQFLGLSVGCIVHGLSDSQRRESYGADITYGTNHEFGFDYLRDNMKFSRNEMVQRGFEFAIVDEVDSILIDEARTPLIISGASEDSSDLYRAINQLMPNLQPEHYEKDEKQKSITLTESGVEYIEELLRQADLLKSHSLYDVQNIALVHHVNQALRAHKMFIRDVDYIVKNKKVVIIDEFTGRMMEGRRYSEGLHQALEAKEGVPIEQENQTLASISYQNLFRLYKKLSGMTGTASTEAEEFEQIYKLRTVVVPTNLPVRRIDHDDEVYLTAREKYDAVLKQIEACHIKKQPLLVITPSIEKSEYLSELLKGARIPHNVLNARYHEQEALIIAQAGVPGSVTIATNMAGRGTDIKLGGNLGLRITQETKDFSEEEKIQHANKLRSLFENDKKLAIEAGGLFVLGTERNESRRIDNQARGRSGRQGDPGESKFFVSLEDDLMRIFGSERLDSMLRRLGVKEGEAISHPWISKALERAQKKVEARNFDVRKHLLRYDDVMNEQRKVIYNQRLEFMSKEDLSSLIAEMRQEVVEVMVASHIPEQALLEQWDIKGLHANCLEILGLDLPLFSWIEDSSITPADIYHKIHEESEKNFQAKEAQFGSELMRHAEKNILLRVLDQSWKDHLATLDHLRQGINLRAYAQKNPVDEYKREAFSLFEAMLMRVRFEVTGFLMHFSIDPSQQSEEDILRSILPHAPNASDAEEQGIEFLDQMFSNLLSSMNGEDGTGKAPAELPKDVDLSHLSEQEKNFLAQFAHELVEIAQTEDVPEDEEVDEELSRNSACPCGSGKKYKHCHGTLNSPDS